jgi:hypothetical protein
MAQSGERPYSRSHEYDVTPSEYFIIRRALNCSAGELPEDN